MAKKNQWRNSFWGLVSAVTDIACGLYTSRLLLNTFGAQAYGLMHSINNILGLILAIGCVFIISGPKAYYQPLEQGDRNQLSAIYRRKRRNLFFVLVPTTLAIIIFALTYPLFFLNQFTYWDTALLVFALGLYLLIRTSNRTDVGFLVANYDSYISKILSTFTTLLTTILCYYFVKWGYSLSSIKITVALVLLIHPIFYLFYRHFHYHLTKPIIKLPITFHKPITIWKRIIDIFSRRTDILILTIAATLTDVSIYAVYAMVGKYLTSCINALFDGREAIYGRAFAKDDRMAAKKAYARTQFYLANLLAIIFGIAIVMLNPFVRLYTKFVKGINYSQFWFGFFLLLAQILVCIRNSQNKFIHAAKKVHHKRLLFDAIIEVFINLTISIALIFPLGIIGVAIGTVTAYLYSVIRLLSYRRKYVVKTSLWHTFRRYLPVLIIFIITTITAINTPPRPTNKFEWIVNSITIGIIIIPLDFILNFIINSQFQKQVINFLKHTLRFLKKRMNRFIKQLTRKTKKCVYFIYKAIATSWQRGFIRATRTYFRHKNSINYESTHQDIDDIPYLTTLGKILVNKKINFTNPQTLNEKLNWLKVYHYRDIYTIMSDKAAAKDYVAKTLGPDYVIPTYGVWDKFDDIDWKSLPQTFVLKCTHDSGSFYFIHDKNNVNLDAVRKHFERCLKDPYWRKKRENTYRDVPPRIIAERYLPSLNHRDSLEYKFTCFNGKVVFGTICQGYPHGSTKHRTNDFYTPDFQHLPWRAWYRNARRRPKKPAQWEEMIAISEKFAKDIPYLRVDLYVEDGQIYFGEFTFYTGGGFIEFYPRKMDLILGQQLTLPEPMTPRPFPAIKTDEPSPEQKIDTTTPAESSKHAVPAKPTTPISQSKDKPTNTTATANHLDDLNEIDYDDSDDGE